MHFGVALASALALRSIVSSPANWTQFRLRSDNNAVVPGNLAVSWRLSTSGGFSSSPALAGGTLFIGNNDGQLLAVDPGSGKVRWVRKIDNPIMSAPIVYEHVVIVGEGNEDSPPAATPSNPIKVGDPPSALLAFDRDSGALVWRVALRGTGMPTPAIVAGRLVHHNGYGSVVAVDPLSGRVLYERNVHSIASMSAAVPIGGDVFLTSGVGTAAVWALHAKDGSVRWRTAFSSVASGLGDCPLVADNFAAYGDYAMPPSSATPVQTERSSQERAFAIDLRSGRKRWDVLLEAGILPKRNEASIPLFAQHAVFMGSSISAAVHALDPRTGAIRWRMFARGPVKGGIVDVDGALYFGDLAGYLWAVRASDGHLIGVKNMRLPFNVGSPIVAGQTLIVGSRGGKLVAIPLSVIRNAHDP